MKFKKICVVGCGRVGESFLYSSIHKKQADEYLVIDVNKELNEGVVIDLEDAAIALDYDIKIKQADYKDCKDVDLIVITAGRAQRKNETRLEMIKDNSKIMKIIARSIKESGFQGFTIIVSNPVELLTTVYLKETMFKQEKVIGAGTVLDAMRLKYLLMKRFNQKSNKINDLYVLGEHGDDIIIDWEKVSVNNEKLNDLLQKEDKNEFGKKIILKKLEEETMKRAYKIIKNKGATYLGIGASISKIVDILNNNLKEEVLNVSVYHEDIDLYLSWPVKIDQEKEKIEKLDLKLDQEKIWNQEKKLSDLKLKLKTIFKENN